MDIKINIVPKLFALFVGFTVACTPQVNERADETASAADSLLVEEEKEPVFTRGRIVIEKELAYDQYTLDDTYPYRDTTRMVQWETIRDRLFFLDSIQQEPAVWGVVQNYKNLNGEAPLIRKWHRDEYKLVADDWGVARYQSVPLYAVHDRDTAERYLRDGSLVKIIKQDSTAFTRVEAVWIGGEWLVPNKYLKVIGDTVSFHHTVVVDRENQNIVTLEKVDSIWYARSINPATTGLHHPPYGHATPIGMFVIQEKKPKMIYLKDGSSALGGFAPHASRFTNGAYLHGVPVNAPRTSTIEYSQTLGTTPRSHMCVRNATSHAKFIYDWAPTLASIVFVIE
ncbi:hypothetical protein M2480_000672 [Parabacteroides sp. PFB2-12]|uniref:L,D-transpeptidase n=1 Tax=unclassified Parabacteroides TaxID=2649774 RepID=UPI002473E7BB|nr:MULTISPECIES: L,D-transpeptidase [unclassified Parabacteroides]MDH6342009.1 hypothetical protein [Parabacteroides sp. PM6-13]MDH6389707.1 hypothetical protein [Parabacteroides sp. PFB2-12]